MDSYEETFAQEAQDEALLSRTTSIDRPATPEEHAQSVVTNEESEAENENSPLIRPSSQQGSKKRRNHKREKSYERAINEPWHGAHGAGDLPWYKRPSVLWLLPAFFPYCIAIGGIIVPKTYLIYDLICRDYLSEKALQNPALAFTPVVFGSENPQCDGDPRIQSRTAIFNLYMNLLSGLFAAIVSPHLGALSDRRGRISIIVITSIGGLAGELITVAVGLYPDAISVYWMLLGSLLDGLCGSFTSAMALCFAYATDCTPPEQRSVAFGYFHATLFSGVAIGPILARALISVTKSILTPFYVALGCHIFFMLFTYFVVPESLSKERQLLAREKRDENRVSGESWLTTLKKYNPFEPLWVLRPRGEGASPELRRNILIIAVIDTLMFGVAMGTMQVILIYVKYRFHWDAIAASDFISAANVSRVFGLTVLLPLATRLVRGPRQRDSKGHRGADMLDINIIRVAIFLDLIGYLGYAVTPSGTIMVASSMVAALGGMGSPALASSLTKHLPPDRTGQILGASGLLHALARVVAPTIFNLIYSATVGTYAGAVFVCLATVFVLVFILSWFLKPNVYFVDNSSIADLPGQDVDRPGQDENQVGSVPPRILE